MTRGPGGPGNRTGVRRLLAPRSVVVVGGAAAERVVEQCRAIGYDGELWAVHPTRRELAGVPCVPDVASLPGVPDAAFVSVPREATVEVVGELAAVGTGGVVCHASGFAEDGDHGADLQRALVAAAGSTALVGPNCLGLVNYLDGAALTPDQHGGARVERGVAVITQSGNLALNISMQRRSLPLAALVTVGNCAVTSIPELLDALLDDPRVTAVGLHLEDLPDVAELTRVATRALRAGVPVVTIKAGTSPLGRQAAASHTSALATPDVLCDALFRRLGIARVRRVETFVETLKLLHVHGALPGSRITSSSCSGGEAALLADLAAAVGVDTPPLPPEVIRDLHELLGDRVAVGNPLDYHTYIWDDLDALTRCFTSVQSADADLHLLLLDLPREDRCDGSSYLTALTAYRAAQAVTGARTCVVSSLPENLPEDHGHELVAAGVAPMHGVADCLEAVLAARDVGNAQAAARTAPPTAPPGAGPPAPRDAAPAVVQHDEGAAKRVLAGHGVRVPDGEVVGAGEAEAAAARLGYPVVVKAVAEGLAHKSDTGAVRLGLTSPQAVRDAVDDLAGQSDRFLVEAMVDGVVAELVVGVGRDPRVGLHLTLGAGGVLVELLRDTVTLLLPVAPGEVLGALRRLRVWPLLAGYRGRAADVAALVETVEQVAACAVALEDRLVDLEVNPLLALEDGAVAVDALLRTNGPVDERVGSRPVEVVA